MSNGDVEEGGGERGFKCPRIVGGNSSRVQWREFLILCHKQNNGLCFGKRAARNGINPLVEADSRDRPLKADSDPETATGFFFRSRFISLCSSN